MLWVTEQTVKFHLSNVYRKLNVSNRTEASRWAQINGLLPARTGPGGEGDLRLAG
jgi:DNA-binding CsgD family transcriptional regulator